MAFRFGSGPLQIDEDLDVAGRVLGECCEYARSFLQPDAVVEHHHLHTFAGFLAERYRRGRRFGELRCSWLAGRRGALLGYLLVTALPIRLARIMALVAAHAAQAGQTGRYLATLPITLAGHAASLAGETVTYARRLGPAPPAGG